MAAYDFQTYQPHPYVHALGNATVAARGSPGAIGINPATIGTAGAVRVGSNVNLKRGPVYSSPRPLLPFGDPLIRGRWITAPSGTVQIGRWAAGLQIKHFSRSISSRIDDISVFYQSVKLAAAYGLTSSLTLGVGGNLIRRRLITSLEADLPFSPGTNGTKAKTEDRTHLTVDLGLHYETRIERGIVALRPAFGLSLTDFGGNVPVKDVRGKQLSLGRKKLRGDRPTPMMIRGGGALQVVSQSQRFGRPEWRIGLYGALSNLLVSGETVEGNNGVYYYEADGPFSTLLNG